MSSSVIPVISAAQLEALRGLDSCGIANAIETKNLRLRNQGYIKPGLKCLFSHFDPMIGYAVTSRIKCSDPPVTGGSYFDRTDWWNLMDGYPSPRVAVIQDSDPEAGLGSAAGEVHGAILKALQCTGIVTDGAVRNIPALEALGLQVFTRHISPSHAYVHMIEFGKPVEISGLTINPGDLLFGDIHGVITIPPDIVEELPAIVEAQTKQKRTVVDLCRSPEFSIEKLREAVQGLG